MSPIKLLSPLRLATGWGANPRYLGGLAIVMLVLLRVTIGWHFFSEGHNKWEQGNWDAKPFFQAAQGPFANRFRRMVWDWDGRLRLDVEKTKAHFAGYRDRAIRHFGFNDAQKRQAQINYAKSIEQLQWLIEANKNDLEEYRLGRQRIAALDADANRGGVASLAGQTETIRKEMEGKINPVLRQIDTLWSSYEAAQNGLATTQQMAAKSPLAMSKPRNQLIDTSIINKVIPYFDMAIGVCLVIGLFTPVAALAAAVFLGQVFLSQFPPPTGPGSSYQLIEALACLVLAATAAGRLAGLDFYIHAWTQKLIRNHLAVNEE